MDYKFLFFFLQPILLLEKFSLFPFYIIMLALGLPFSETEKRTGIQIYLEEETAVMVAREELV
jgi:hypothetical protein